MTVVALTALIFGFVTAALEVVLPLWATKELGYSAGQWAQLRSLRMWGVAGGVIILGAISDRFGQRTVGAVCLLGVAVLLGLLGLGQGRGIWLLMPFLGALISTVFVNLNTLTQQVSEARPGLANTIYRSIGAGMGIAAPIAATILAVLWGGYNGVFLLMGALSLAAALALFFYPDELTATGWNGLRAEVRVLHQGYVTALRRREMMRLLHPVSAWYAVMAGVGAFAAIRFTRELGQSDQEFGVLSAIAAGAGLLATLGGGFMLDRVSLRRLHIVGCAAGSTCAVLMGIGDSLLLSGIGFVVLSALSLALVGGSSMWLSRVAGPNLQGAGFTVFKILSAFYVAVIMALLGVLEQWMSLRAIFLGVGLCGLGLSLLFVWLDDSD